MENIQKIFYQDCSEKKRTARGIYNRASRKKGIKGAVRLNNYTAKEIKSKHGKLVCYSMFDSLETLPEYKYFKILPKHERKRLLEEYCERHNARAIAEYWNKTIQFIHNLKFTLGVRKKMGNISMENILTLEQYQNLDKPNRLNALLALQAHFKKSNGKYDPNAIASFWGVKKQYVFDQIHSCGLNKVINKDVSVRRKKDSSNIVNTNSSVVNSAPFTSSDVDKALKETHNIAIIEKPIIVEKPVYIEKPISVGEDREILGFNFSNRAITGKELAKKLFKYAVLLEESEEMFKGTIVFIADEG